jgi:GT2 family glycosyltransferase/acetyltransferase-like isoleucine patch superfamily enzyme
MRRLLLLMAVFLPGPLKRQWYRRLFGWRIGARVRIGLSYLDAAEVELGDDVSIGHFNVVQRVQRFVVGRDTHILNFNTFSGSPYTDPGWVRSVTIGPMSSIMSRHFFDVAGELVIGPRVTLAGRDSQLWTHTMVEEGGRTRLIPAALHLGAGCYIGARSTLLFCTLPEGCLVGAGSVVTKSFEAAAGRLVIAGNPAAVRKTYPAVNAPVPLISVVIPTCRRPELLARCLDRLAPGRQTLAAERYEVLVTDDGGPTVERLLAEKYPWASWGQGPRRGPAANRNAGAARARGPWLAFTDDDCVPDTGWLAGFLAAVHDGCQAYEGKTTCAAGIASPLQAAPVNTSGGYLWSCNLLIRRDTFGALGGFDEAFPYAHLEDVDFRERLLQAGLRFEFVPAAAVDHPPRRQPSGWRLARTHQSDVYYWYKTGRRGWCTPRVLRDIIRFRLAAAGQRPGWHTPRAVGSMIVELGTSLCLLPLWEWKYRRRVAAEPRPEAVAAGVEAP